MQGIRDNLTLMTSDCDDFDAESLPSSSATTTTSNAATTAPGSVAPLTQELEQLSQVLHQILLLQDADGTWSLDPTLLSLLNISQEKIIASAENKVN